MKHLLYITLFIFISLNSLYSEEKLRSSENQADYLVIYHPEFEESLEKFIEWRRSKAVNVFPVNVESIYAQFGDTVSNVEAIKNFVSYSLEYWGEPKPEYLLLVGGINHIPSKKVDEHITKKEFDSVSIDDYYAINKYQPDENSNIPNIAIGRFPARKSEDLNAMIEKTIMFEDSSEYIDYKYDFLIPADRVDYKGFENDASIIKDDFIPDYLKVKRIDSRENSKYYGSKEEFINNIKEGTSFLFNIFHGNPDVWMSDEYLTSNDVDSITFTSKPFLIAAMSCSQRWDDTTKMRITEKLLAKERSGAVASLAANGLTYASFGFYLIKALSIEMFQNQELTYGKATQKAKAFLNESLFLRHTYLGDPMLKLPEWFSKPMDVKSISEDSEFYNYPNPCDNYTNIVFSMENSSQVSIDIFDMLGNKITRLANDFYDSGINKIKWDTSNLFTGFYLCKLQTENKTHSKIIIVE